MEKSTTGSLTIIFGSLVLSIQLYGLKIIQGLEIQKGSWRTHAIDYVKETPITLSLWITVAVILYGFILLIGTDKIKGWLTQG